jgi:hypothetical protein
MNKKIDRKVENDIVNKHDAKMSQYSIAALHGISRRSVQRVLIKYGRLPPRISMTQSEADLVMFLRQHAISISEALKYLRSWKDRQKNKAA